MDLDLTLPGGGAPKMPKMPEPPPPPPPPPKPPTMVDARQALAARRGTQRPRRPAHITNTGGGGGIPIAGSVQTATKALTAQRRSEA